MATAKNEVFMELGEWTFDGRGLKFGWGRLLQEDIF